MYSERIVPLLRTQIAWKSDKSIKYHNPEHSEGNLKEGILYNHLHRLHRLFYSFKVK